ncbi:MAG: hypothetical protein EBV07_01300, partial [Proteobacteria bacterium]|nr:hypothetical protein [Pseudomonadota bacterium]
MNPKDEMLNLLLTELLTLPKFRDYSSEKKEALKDKLVKEYDDRINKAIDSGEKIFVWGDYDVDGITST